MFISPIAFWDTWAASGSPSCPLWTLRCQTGCKHHGGGIDVIPPHNPHAYFSAQAGNWLASRPLRPARVSPLAYQQENMSQVK